MDIPSAVRSVFSRSTSNVSQNADEDLAEDDTTETSVIDDLQSTAQRELMDAIDRLRSQLSRELDLPQVIVCGDQSAGKSSVLEAIARVSFPTGKNTTTRFATEIVLRRAAQCRMNVSIQPGPGTNNESEEYFQGFSANMTSLEDIPRVVEQATEHMLRRERAERSFCEHRLRVEISGPSQPHLTLVDLPGLIANTPNPTSDNDIQVIRQLNEFYMQQPRSIILAVMSAQNDYLTQPVFRMAREVDPRGQRTMGILTKPDLVEDGAEDSTIFLARNEGDAVLDLGWHVLRNRTLASAHATSEERDTDEARFFRGKPAWKDLPEDLRGIGSLRQKLSKVLFHTITMSLPAITSEISDKLNSCSQRLEKLGSPRQESSQQRYFLTDVSLKLWSLACQALDGHYHDTFFRNNTSDLSQAKRLGTRLANIAENFAKRMQLDGHRFHTVEDGVTHCAIHDRVVRNALFTFTSDHEARCVTPNAALIAATIYVAQNKSRGLPGDAPSNGDADIIKVQSDSWEDIALAYIEQCVQAVQQFFQLTLHHIAPEYTANMIMAHIGRKKIDDCRSLASQKVHELVSPFRKSFVTTQNPGYILNKLQSGLSQSENNAEGQRRVAPVLLTSDTAAARAILEKVQSYYPIALYSFVDNVISLAVENCIVEPLKLIFEAREVSEMDDEQLSLIGSEPPRVVHERERDLGKQVVLREVLQVCNKYVGAPSATAPIVLPTTVNSEAAADHIESADLPNQQRSAEAASETPTSDVSPFTRQHLTPSSNRTGPRVAIHTPPASPTARGRAAGSAIRAQVSVR